MRFHLAIGAVLAFAAWGCTGDRYGTGSGTMTTPTPAATVSPGASVVTIAGQKGMLSFDPNPALMAQGSLVSWHNADTAVHRIVMNDGSFDSGDIAPGGSSSMMRLGAAGGGYHCTIHPTMMFGSFMSTN